VKPPPGLVLRLLPQAFAVCRFAPDAPLPAWVFHTDATVWSLTRTSGELSLVCPEDDLPPSLTRDVERPWRAFALDGPIPFGTTGVIASLTSPLADAGVPVFVLSTYDTDLLLVPSASLGTARAVLAARFTVHAA
jgi:uncharacterized protein